MKETDIKTGSTVDANDLRVGVYVCHCGKNIGGTVRCEEVAAFAQGLPGVVLGRDSLYTCSEPGQEQINELVKDLQRAHALTVLFISHELNVVSRYATNVLCLSHGVSCFGPPRTVLTPDVLRDMYGTAVHYHVHGHAHDHFDDH